MTQEHDYNWTGLLKRFPTSRPFYCYSVGRLKEVLISNLSDDLLNDIAELHFTLKDKDCDVQYNRSNLALECINVFKPLLDYSRIRRIKSNLKGFKYKGIVVSCMSPRMKRQLRGIPILELGFQLLPSEYLSFYSRQHKTKYRKFVNRRTMKILVNRLFSFYLRIGVIKRSLSVNKSKISCRHIMLNNTVTSAGTVIKNIIRESISGLLTWRTPWVGWCYT